MLGMLLAILVISPAVYIIIDGQCSDKLCEHLTFYTARMKLKGYNLVECNGNFSLESETVRIVDMCPLRMYFLIKAIDSGNVSKEALERKSKWAFSKLPL